MLERLIGESEPIRQACDQRGETCSHITGYGYVSEDYVTSCGQIVAIINSMLFFGG